MIILGLSGKKQSGKDTVATLIQQLVSPAYNFYRLGFADQLYREVAIMLLKNDSKHPTEQLISEKIKAIQLEKPRYRSLLQWYGTEYRRQQNDRYWIDRWVEKALAISEDQKPVLLVCTDVRFPNEYDCIKKCGGLMWRIERPTLYSIDTHESEIALDKHSFDYAINNDGTTLTLKEQLKSLLQITIKEHNTHVNKTR